MNTMEKKGALDGAELKALAQTVRYWQTGHGITDAELLRSYPQLGTDRTYRRARSGDVGQIDLERWVHDYKSVINIMDAIDSEKGVRDETFDDFSTVTALRVAFVGAMQQAGNSRLVLVHGSSGCGKTTALRLLQERFGSRRIVLCEATDLWRSGKTATSAMLGDILGALGTADAPTSTVAKLDKCVDLLKQTRVCLAIDEAHHCGPTALNLLKTLVNRTPGEFVLCAMGTLWRRLETGVYEEARQLTQNRLYERIQFESASRPDVALLLSRSLRLTCNVAGAVAAVAAAAANNGGLKFAAKVARTAAELAGDGDCDMDTIGKAIVTVQRRS